MFDSAPLPPPPPGAPPPPPPGQFARESAPRRSDARARRLVAVFVVVFLLVGVSFLAVLLSRTPSGGGAASILLSEVRFLPKPGDPQFVELKNAGTASLGLAGLVLANTSGATYSLPAGSTALVPGGFALILFDGQRRVDGTTVHSDLTELLDRDAGNLTVRSPGGVVLDHVGWGPGQPDGVRLGGGGKVLPLAAGATIGRFPHSVTPSYRFDWGVFAPDLVTPGAENPIPAVALLDPLDGAILNVSAVPLWWYPPAGAVQYRLQLGSDPSLASPLVDKVVRGHSITTDPLAPGRYFWRVQAIESDGSASAFFPVSSFVLVQARGMGLGVDSPRATNEAILPVPVFQSRKDTSLLLLEAEKTGANRWDAPHSGADSENPADYMNCAFASISMVNHALGGDFSQDRLSFEVYKNRHSGPSDDFQFADGLLDRDQPKVMTLAFGAPGIHVTDLTPDGMWLNVTEELGAGRPILLDVGEDVASHEVVIAGFRDDGGNRSIQINNPGSGTSYWLPFDISPNGFNASKGWRYQAYWMLSTPVTAGKQEASITTDSDQDGMMDFDETERFHTQVNNTDSDGDGIGDKVEVMASVFDTEHGYQSLTIWSGLGPLYFTPKAFDFDGDKKPMWLDWDSDNGGCSDGQEDANHDGVRDSGEISNFDPKDDGVCSPKGTGTLSASLQGSGPNATGRGTIRVDITNSSGYVSADPNPNATYDWYIHYGIQGNVSLKWESSASYTDPDPNPPDYSWTRHDTTACDVPLRGTLRMEYNATKHNIHVVFGVHLGGPCVTRGERTDSNGVSVQNHTIDYSFAFTSDWVSMRLRPTCGNDTMSGDAAICPVALSKGIATARDAGSLDPKTLYFAFNAASASYFDAEAWDFQFTFRLGQG